MMSVVSRMIDDVRVETMTRRGWKGGGRGGGGGGCGFFFFSSRRRHTRYWRDWSSDVCSSDLQVLQNENQAFLLTIKKINLNNYWATCGKPSHKTGMFFQIGRASCRERV